MAKTYPENLSIVVCENFTLFLTKTGNISLENLAKILENWFRNAFYSNSNVDVPQKKEEKVLEFPKDLVGLISDFQLDSSKNKVYWCGEMDDSETDDDELDSDSNRHKMAAVPKLLKFNHSTVRSFPFFFLSFSLCFVRIRRMAPREHPNVPKGIFGRMYVWETPGNGQR